MKFCIHQKKKIVKTPYSLMLAQNKLISRIFLRKKIYTVLCFYANFQIDFLFVSRERRRMSICLCNPRITSNGPLGKNWQVWCTFSKRLSANTLKVIFIIADHHSMSLKKCHLCLKCKKERERRGRQIPFSRTATDKLKGSRHSSVSFQNGYHCYSKWFSIHELCVL